MPCLSKTAQPLSVELAGRPAAAIFEPLGVELSCEGTSTVRAAALELVGDAVGGQLGRHRGGVLGVEAGQQHLSRSGC